MSYLLSGSRLLRRPALDSSPPPESPETAGLAKVEACLHILSKRKGEGPVLGARAAAFTSQLCHLRPALGRSQHYLPRPRGVDVSEGLGAPAEA